MIIDNHVAGVVSGPAGADNGPTVLDVYADVQNATGHQLIEQAKQGGARFSDESSLGSNLGATASAATPEDASSQIGRAHV